MLPTLSTLAIGEPKRTVGVDVFRQVVHHAMTTLARVSQVLVNTNQRAHQMIGWITTIKAEVNQQVEVLRAHGMPESEIQQFVHYQQQWCKSQLDFMDTAVANLPTPRQLSDEFTTQLRILARVADDAFPGTQIAFENKSAIEHIMRDLKNYEHQLRQSNITLVEFTNRTGMNRLQTNNLIYNWSLRAGSQN